MCEVVNINKSSYDVYIMRPSKWGNPFKLVNDNREDVLQHYKEYIINSELKNDLHELQGKKLGCVCKPKRYHGDILVELVNRYCKTTKHKQSNKFLDNISKLKRVKNDN